MPGFGVFEFIPDTFPFIGNLDEATATLLLLSTLAYFGIDPTISQITYPDVIDVASSYEPVQLGGETVYKHKSRVVKND